MDAEEQVFDLSMPAVVDKYKSAGAIANGTAEKRMELNGRALR
jgi:hypothetical protein